MGRSSTLSRHRRQHLVEHLEERRLLSLAIDLRIDVGNAGNTDPASIINAHTIQSPQVGDVYQLQIWAQIHGADSDGSNDSLDLLYGSIIASDLRTGGYFGAVQGSFTVPTLEPYFDSTTYEASAGTTYTDANGNIDAGSTSTDSSVPQDFFHPVSGGSISTTTTALLNGQSGITSLSVNALSGSFSAGTQIELISGSNQQTVTLAANAASGATTLQVQSFTANFAYSVGTTVEVPAPTNLLGQGSSGAGEEEELGTTTFTVTAVENGPPTTLIFYPRPQGSGWVSALWYEDGTVKDTYDGDTISPSTGITITEPDTIAPTAAATLSPILGSTTSYQFTVNYSDNQDLNLTDFSSSNILVTGPNGYSQMATVVGSPVDADPSSNTQYDPYNVTYQITPPDSSWSIADNGAYTFTLEANQIADNSGNFAPTQVLGGGPLNVQFTGAVSITPATASIGENSSTPFAFTVTRTDAIGDGFADAMTVSYTVTGTAVAGTNFTAPSGSVTIPAGQASAVVDVQPLDDQIIDGDTTVILTLGNGATYVLGNPTGATLTVANTDTVSASIADVSVGRSSADQTVDFTVTLSGAATIPIYVDYATSDDTAIAGTDYTATNGVLTFAPGTTSETIPVTVLGSTGSGDVDFHMNLSVDPQSADELTIANTPAVATIADVIPAALSPLSVSVTPGLTATNVAFTVTLASAPTESVTVTYATADGTAVANTDYTATSGTLTFAPGQTTQTIDVPILPVIRSDAGKEFTLGITAGSALVSVDPSVATATATLQTPNFTELPINSKTGATYTDAAGNKVTVKVSGISASTFSGDILFPTGGPTTGVNAVGIVINGTTAKSTLTISTKSTSLDFIDISGSLKTLSAKSVTLSQSASTSTTPYFTTTGSATTISLGTLSSASINSSAVKTFTAGNLTGTTVNITGTTTAKMTFGNIQDCSITDSASLSSFSTTQWLNTDSTADLLSVAGLKTLTSKGNFQAALSAGIVGTISIKGAWSNSVFAITSVKKMSVGTASSSSLYASANPNSTFPPTSSDLAVGGQIGSVSVTSKAAGAFSSTIIDGQYIGTLSLGAVTADNSGDLFGVATQYIKSITGSDSTGKFSMKNLTNAQPGTPVSDQDFSVQLIA
jgi:hypothetical protein